MWWHLLLSWTTGIQESGRRQGCGSCQYYKWLSTEDTFSSKSWIKLCGVFGNCGANGQIFPLRKDSYLQWFRNSFLTYLLTFLTSHTTKPTGRKKGHCTYWPRWIILITKYELECCYKMGVNRTPGNSLVLLILLCSIDVANGKLLLLRQYRIRPR